MMEIETQDGIAGFGLKVKLEFSKCAICAVQDII
jgi:hypothetical protein